ncbi:MAG: hypothetical protein LBG59_09220 [Candidatus Peribacteria bacterium]|jgi:hypothetical protein|nr:hypothetical protein [Candidatus Peribacteria bacterium]
MTDPFEDFAECHNFYLNHHDLLVTLARTNESLAAKFNYFANLYGGDFFSDSSFTSQGVETTWRAWDTTRIQE